MRQALVDLGLDLGERATLLQFSSAFCAPCRATRRTLAEVARVVPGVVHLDVDAEQHLQLVRDVGVESTPTTLVLDSGGREVLRATGQPRPATVLAAISQALGVLTGEVVDRRHAASRLIGGRPPSAVCARRVL